MNKFCFIALGLLFLSGCSPKTSDFRIGDCITVAGKEGKMKITEIGKNSLEVIWFKDGDFVSADVFPRGVEYSQKVDCFHTFDNYNQPKGNK